MGRRVVGKAVGAALTGVLAASALAAGVPASYGAAAVEGPLTSGDMLFPNQGNGGYDATHYDLKYVWSAGTPLSASTIEATATMTARTTGQALSSFGLDFEGANLTVRSVKVNGVAAAFTRIDGPTAVAPAPPEAHKLVVTPATAVEGPFTVEVVYGGVPSTHVDQDNSWEGWVPTSDGMIFMGQPVGSMAGFPNNNTPADKATYTISLDIPNTITNTAGTGAAAAISNGVLQSKTTAGDRTTWVWNQAHQMASELVIISIGKYDVAESQIELSDGRTIPEWSFIDSAQSTANKTTFTTRRAQLGPIIRRLESIYGPYPYDSTGAVVDSVPGSVSYALETQDRSFFPSVGQFNGNTLIHELAHQWYGDNVSPKVWNDIWINEGMGTWGPTWHNSVLAAATPNPGAVETQYFNSWNNTAPTSSNWSVAPSGMTDTRTLYGYQTYTRGAQLYEALRTAIGDAAYFTFLKLWQSRYDDGNGGARDFEALAEEVSGRDLTAFFQDWVWETGKPVWPGKFNLALTSDTESGEVQPGTPISYTATVTNTGKVTLGDAVVTLDLTDVLDDATLGPLPDGVTRAGDVLTWAVPSTPVTAGSNVATVAVPVTVRPDASSATLEAEVSSATLGSNCSEATCTTANSVGIQALSPVPTPSVNGTPVVAQTLTAVPGSWPAGTTLSYQWVSGAEVVPGATGSTYVVRPADAGRNIAVRVTGAKSGYTSVTRQSPATAVVDLQTVQGDPQVQLSGKAKVGKKLKAQIGSWPSDATITYLWLVGGEPVKASGPSLKLKKGFKGKKVVVEVTIAQPGYATVNLRSKASGKVR